MKLERAKRVAWERVRRWRPWYAEYSLTTGAERARFIAACAAVGAIWAALGHWRSIWFGVVAGAAGAVIRIWREVNKRERTRKRAERSDT